MTKRITLGQYYLPYKEKLMREKMLRAKTTSDKVAQDRWRLQTVYGLSLETYRDMVKRRKGTCDICGKKQKHKLCVDHNHKTNRIRGLLCYGCNSAIGRLKDSVPMLQKAIRYLKKYE